MNLSRSKKAMLTSVSALVHQIVMFACGFILPRFFLLNFGSAVNGLVSSITQFLGFISLAECGVGAVVQSTLYKPLAKKDNVEISKIFASSNSFFKKIGIILLFYTVALAFCFPFFTSNAFDKFFSSSLVIIISISTFSQYFVGMTYKLLLGADQCGYIDQIISSIALIVNTVLSIILMNAGCGVHLVKLISSFIFLAKPFIYMFIAKRKYNIDRNIVLEEEPIKQKWNGLAQHIASVVNGNTDTIVLTIFSSLENVSVYSVYNLVINGVKSIVTSLTSGFIAFFGNMLACESNEKTNTYFGCFEWVLHTATTFVFTLTGLLIIPFLSVYTKGVNDANYFIPSFSLLITLANAAYCLRLPYNIITMAAGHYRETQISAIIEAFLNVIISVVFVFKYGLVGVAIGTLVAMLYRTVYLARYLSKNILFRSMRLFIKHCIVDLVSVFAICFATSFFDKTVDGYFSWVILSVKIGVISLCICSIINFVVYRQEFSYLIKYLQNKTQKKADKR